jgi:hypothetical protein
VQLRHADVLVDTLVLGDGLAPNGGAEVKRILTASASLDFPSIAAGGGVQA